MTQTLFAKALGFSSHYHLGQFDKAGVPYITHPIRVAEAFTEDLEKTVGVLHDVVEDTTATIEDIYAEFGAIVGQSVKAMTKLDGEKYRDYLDRVKADHIAFKVKMADMDDNSRPDRLAYLSIEKQLRIICKYTRGRHYLLTGEWHESKDLDRVIKAPYKK